jgi:predicted transporter
VICGAVALTPLSFIIPVIILWNKKNKETAPTWRLCLHYMLIIIFIVFAILALTGAVYDLVQPAFFTG